MNTAKQASENSGIHIRLIRSVIRTVGKDSIEDIYNHGADGGYPGITYYDEAGQAKEGWKTMSKTIKLVNGTMDSNGNLDGWIITSTKAVVDGAEDIALRKGDRITADGDVYRGEEFLGNVA